MGYNHPDILKANPYYDDFDDTKNFLRVLFKPGYAIQSRELTQLQTLLQNQISKLGSHIFKDGSQVFGGGVSLNSAEFIRISIASSADVSKFKGTTISQGSTKTARVIDVLDRTSSDDYVILAIQYLTGEKFETGELSNDDSSYFSSYMITYNSEIENATGVCQTLSVSSGIFYIDGFFVNNTDQIATLYVIDDGIRKFRDPILTTEGVTNRIGFEVTRTLVSATDDSTLVDPARGFYNYNAPGQDRYRIDLVLKAQEFDDQSIEPGEFATKDFIELARVVYGILDYVKKVPTYAELVDTLARRTYDESGNYTVKHFDLEVKNHYRNDIYSLYVKVNDDFDTSIFVVGDGIYSTELGGITKNSEIIGFVNYVPTAEELNSNNSENLPTHIFHVTRNPLANGTLDYEFFDANDSVVYSVAGGTASSLGTIKSVTAIRDPGGTYSPEEGGSDSKFVLSVKPGKAYVFGYEFETINNTNIVVDKKRSEALVSLDDYNLGANVGNYFVVSAPFNNWNSNIYLEETPFMKFGGRYIRITIPNQDEDKRTGIIKYWSPLSMDQDQENFRSVAFLTLTSALGIESIPGHIDPSSGDYLHLIDADGETDEDDVFDVGFIRPQETNRPEAKYLGGGSSQTSYPLVNLSNEVESDVSRMVFTDPWHGNFASSYDLSSEDSAGSGTYTTSEYRVKQIKCLDITSPTSIQVTTGKILRWIPASPYGEAGVVSPNGSTLYVQVENSIKSTGETEDVTPHFNLDDGVVFADPAVSEEFLSYGTSILYVNRESRVKKVIVRPTGIPGGEVECTTSGQGGFYSIGDIVTQTYELNGVQVQAVGEVIAINGDFNIPTQGNDGVEVYVQSQGVYDFYGINDDVVGDTNNDSDEQTIVTNLGCMTGSCGLFIPRSTQDLCGELVRIGFRDLENYGEYIINGTVFQYDFRLLGSYNGLPSYSEVHLVKGKTIAWNATAKELILLETQGRFDKYNGTIYQMASGQYGEVKYGGRGWDRNKTKHSADDTFSGVALYDIEKVSGIFADLTSYQNKDFIETASSVWSYPTSTVAGETMYQLASPAIGSFDGQEFVPNDTVYQDTGTNGVATGVVLSFTHRDLTNPADESNTVLVIQPTNDVSFIVGTTAVGRYLKSQTNTSLLLDVSGHDTKKAKEIIGAGRMRLLRRQDADAYQAYFYDIKMDYLPDLSRRYNLNEVETFFYEDSFATSYQINDFEEEDIQLDPSVLDSDYAFIVHPTKGIEEPTTGQIFTYSKIYDTNRNSLLFSLPGGAAIQSVGEMDYRIQKHFHNGVVDPSSNSKKVEFNTGSANIRFIGGESSTVGTVDSNDIIEHYILLNGNTIIDLTTGNYTVKTNNYSSPSSPATVTIEYIGSGGGPLGASNVSLVCNLNVNASHAGIRTKTIRREQKTITLKKTKDGTWKGVLPRADIHAIDHVGYVSAATTNAVFDFDFFDGQTDNIYDFGYLVVRSNYLVNSEPKEKEIVVNYRYFEHGGEGPITVGSYSSALQFKNIPYYSSNSGERVKLDSVIDCRPLKKDNGDGTVSIVGKWIPAPATSFDVDYSYYLSRAYKLMITRDQKFKLVSGVPAFEPELPPDDDNAMTIYDIYTGPYVFGKEDVTFTMVNNRRYTMQDIIELDNRIGDLEEYVSLNTLEMKALTDRIVDVETELERIKTSVLVDNFSEHSGDVDNDTYNVAVDSDENLIRPPFLTGNIDLDESSIVLSGLIKTVDNMILLNYEQSPLITQYSASGVEKVNPFNDVSWIGNVKLSPSSDSMFDADELPVIKKPTPFCTTATPMEFNWKSWKKAWSGMSRATRKKRYFGTFHQKGKSRSQLSVDEAAEKFFGMDPIAEDVVTNKDKWRKRKGRDRKRGYRRYQKKIKERAASQQKEAEVDVGNKIVDVSLDHWVRDRKITVTADALRPHSVVYIFFDDVDITQECNIENSIGSKEGTGALKTTSSGTLKFSFDIGKRRFKSGEKLLVITDSITNNPDDATTVAEAVYVAAGAIDSNADGVISTRKSKKKPSSYRKNVSDPVAQTFFVDGEKYPEGVLVSSIDLFFSEKDTVLPIQLELRPTNLGYPATRDKTLVYPFSSVVVYPDDVVTTTDPNASAENTRTRFEFTTPVHLLPGEHALTLKTNSSKYSVYVATIGDLLINSESRITQQAAVGAFFKSQNAGSWTIYENTDLMFAINMCSFAENANGTAILKDTNNVAIPDVLYHLYSINIEELKFNNTNIEYRVKTMPLSPPVLKDYAPVISNTNITLPETNIIKYDGESFEAEIKLSSQKTYISPMFDLDRLTIISIRNLVENNVSSSKTDTNYNGELDPTPPVVYEETNKVKPNIATIAEANKNVSRCRYITKIVELDKGFESTNVNVKVGVNTPADTKIQVYVKQQTAGKDSSFDDEPYLELVPDKDITSPDEETFEDITYKLPANLEQPFGKYAVKICMYSGNPARVPKVKEMRTVSVI